MADKNGEIVMDALRALNGPSTLSSVVRQIANRHQVQPSYIKEPVKMVLEKGVEFGFIQKNGFRYKADLNYDDPEPGPEGSFPNPAEAGGRRRRRSSSRKRRSRSRRRSKSRRHR
ncbi:uncharacterized protein LOC119650789 [Hermetia illucens]|uniref:uncharacterized protein LOC119650789 n=1 Tax=Hermetia illucens TaxID=343691 RepID=UPI0018CC27B4|nr:uncharacterized protein LOC119650789 [Hermetia illucens]